MNPSSPSSLSNRGGGRSSGEGGEVNPDGKFTHKRQARLICPLGNSRAKSRSFLLLGPPSFPCSAHDVRAIHDDHDCVVPRSTLCSRTCLSLVCAPRVPLCKPRLLGGLASDNSEFYRGRMEHACRPGYSPGQRPLHLSCIPTHALVGRSCRRLARRARSRRPLHTFGVSERPRSQQLTRARIHRLRPAR